MASAAADPSETFGVSASGSNEATSGSGKAAEIRRVIELMKNIHLPGLPGKKPHNTNQTPGAPPAAAAAGSAAPAAAGTTGEPEGDTVIKQAAAAIDAAGDAVVAAAATVEVTAAATLHEVAGIITSMARDHLGSLLVHPGHATVGVYYLAKRHQMNNLADHIDGSRVGDKELVQQLIRYVDISDSVYPDRFPELVQKEQVVKESDILFFYTQVHKLQPGFFLALDHEHKSLLWVIRGTHDIHDLLTDLCGVATPLPQPPYPERSVAHWGMWRAAGWLLDNHWERVLGCLRDHPGYNLQIIGHSMGGGVGALIALRLHTEEAFVQQLQQLGGVQATCLGVASAACLNGELASAVTPYVTTIVMRYDLVPRFSAGQVVALQQELLEMDYKGLLHEDLLQHEVYRKAFERSTAVAAQLSNSRKVQAAATAAAAAAAAAQAKAMAASGALVQHIDRALASVDGAGAPAAGGAAIGAAAVVAGGQMKGVAVVLQNDKVKQVAVWVSNTLKDATAGGVAPASYDAGATPDQAATQEVPATSSGGLPAAAGGGDGSGVRPTESFEDAGEAAVAAEAAAAGSLVDVTLYAPGRLLYVKPIDSSVEEDTQHFELLDGKGDQRFKRIVLRSTCMSDHFPVAYKAGLQDVLERMQD